MLSRQTVYAALLTGLLLTPPLEAGGPISSRFGIGNLSGPWDPRSYAMGFTAIGLGGSFINTVNPAGLAGIPRTRLQGGFTYERFLSQDKQASSLFARGDFQGLAVAFPVDTSHGIVLMAAAEPYSRVLYANRGTVAEGGITSTQTFRGSGGLSTLALALSWRPYSDLAIGGKISYIYGRIGQIREVDFADPSFTDSYVDRSWYHSGYDLTFGATLRDVGEFLGMPSLSPLQLGAVVNTSSRLDVTEEQLYTSGGYTDTLRTRHGKSSLPLGIGAGVSFPLSRQLLLAGDCFWQQWSHAEFFSGSDAKLRNTFRASIGMETRPGRERSTFFDLLIYRAGIAYRQDYVEVGGHPVNEWTFTAGTALPIGPESLLNIGLQAGLRGNIDTNIQRDTIFRLSVSVTASEEWFMELIEE